MKNGKVAGPDGIPCRNIKGRCKNFSRNAVTLVLRGSAKKKKFQQNGKTVTLSRSPKKGDLSRYGNYRGITLFSVPGKVLIIIILERMKGKVD